MVEIDDIIKYTVFGLSIAVLVLSVIFTVLTLIIYGHVEYEALAGWICVIYIITYKMTY